MWRRGGKQKIPNENKYKGKKGQMEPGASRVKQTGQQVRT